MSFKKITIDLSKIRICFILLGIILISSLIFSGCEERKAEKKLKESLSYFETFEFTEDSFIEAIKKYAVENSLTSEQIEACSKNESILNLLTSEYYDSLSDTEIRGYYKLWEFLFENLFDDEVVYTPKSLFETVSSRCVQSFEDVSCKYLIGNCESYMAENTSIVKLCKDKGAELFEYFESNSFELYKRDLIDLFKLTNTWVNKNTDIAYSKSYSPGVYYPFAFEDSFWDSTGWEHEDGAGYGFEGTKAYNSLVSCIKSRLRDPDSFQFASSSIRFYCKKSNAVSNGYYNADVFAYVQYRAKNGFGGYVNGSCWLRYNWNSQYFSWYGEETSVPYNGNIEYFNSEYV